MSNYRKKTSADNESLPIDSDDMLRSLNIKKQYNDIIDGKEVDNERPQIAGPTLIQHNIALAEEAVHIYEKMLRDKSLELDFLRQIGLKMHIEGATFDAPFIQRLYYPTSPWYTRAQTCSEPIAPLTYKGNVATSKSGLNQYGKKVEGFQSDYNPKESNLPAAKYLARYLNERAVTKNVKLDAFQTASFVYIGYSFALANHGKRICVDHPKALPVLPTFPTIVDYFNYEQSGGGRDIEKVEPENLGYFAARAHLKEDELVNSIFDELLSNYTGFSTISLHNWITGEGSAWRETVLRRGFGSNIGREEIEKDFLRFEL